jgi:hypothetical protein
MSRGSRFFNANANANVNANANANDVVVGASAVQVAPGVVEIHHHGGRVALGIGLAALTGFVLHDRITKTHAFRGARRDAKHAGAVAKRGYRKFMDRR